jgi:outer membrane protein assembly factor BamB
MKIRKNVTVFMVQMLLILILFCIAISIPSFAQSTAWEQFHGDASHQGFEAGSAPATDTLLWSNSDTNAVGSSSVVVGDGTVFVNGNTELSALNLSNGDMVWNVSVAGDVMNYGSWSSPAYADGMVFLPNDGARYASNGTLIWSGLPWDCNGGPAVADGMVVQGDWDGHFITGGDVAGHYFAFNESTGQQLWQLNITGYAQGTPAYVDGKFFVTNWTYNGNVQGSVLCVNPANGSIIWEADLPTNACGSPTVANGTIYVATYNFYGSGDLIALNESTGSMIFDKSVESSDATPAVAYGNVYVDGGCYGYSYSQNIYCFNATTGDLVWQTPNSMGLGSWTCSVAVADGKVYAGYTRSGAMDFDYNGIYCLDAFNGSVIWSDPNGGSSPAIANNTMITINDKNVYAYNDNGTMFTPTPTPSVSPTPTPTPTATPTPTPSVSPVPVTSDDWSQWQVDDVHSGSTNSSAPVSNVSVAWSRQVNSIGGDGIDVTPLVVGGKVFVFDCNGTTWAFNKTTGSLLWETNTTGGSLETSTPAYGDGKLYSATYNGMMYAFDPNTGSILWSSDITNGTGSLECPITYNDGMLYIGEGLENGVQTKYYYGISAENGSVVWSYPVANTSGFIWGGSVVVGDYLVFPSFEGTLYSVYANNGTLVSSVNLTNGVPFARSDLGMIRSSLVYNNGYIYATCENGQPTGYVFKVGYQNGQFQDDEGWSTPIGFSTSTPVVYGGRIYVGGGEHGNPGKLVCLDVSSGAVLWQYNVSGGVKSSPAVYVDGNNLYEYFTSAQQNGSVYCVDRNGDLVWTYNPPGNAYILQGGVISDGYLYFGTDAGILYAINGSSPPSVPISSFNLSLGSGWNLVSFPVANSSLMASGLNGSGVSVVASFNATSGNYNSYIEGVSPGAYDFSLNCGTGYFMYCPTSASLTIYGVNVSSPSVVVSPGWNMIGWSSYNSTLAKSVCSALTASNSTVIARFNESTGNYDSYILNVSPESYDFTVSPGTGYFVYSSAANPQTLYYNGISQ